MLGSRVGSKGTLRGSVVGSSADDEGPSSGGPAWTIDATSGIGRPISAAEWNALFAAASVAASPPTSIYLCGEAASPLADSVGAFHMAQAGAGHLYQQAVPGWSALSAKLTNGTTGSWVNTDAGLPDLATTSCLLLTYADIPAAAPGATRNLNTIGTNVAMRQMIGATGVLNCFSGAAGVDGVADPKGRQMPIWLRVNRTLGAQDCLTDQEIITPVFGATTGKSCRFGSTAGALGVGYFYGARWDGVSAEMSNATIKAISQTLGWTIPW